MNLAPLREHFQAENTPAGLSCLMPPSLMETPCPRSVAALSPPVKRRPQTDCGRFRRIPPSKSYGQERHVADVCTAGMRYCCPLRKANWCGSIPYFFTL